MTRCHLWQLLSLCCAVMIVPSAGRADLIMATSSASGVTSTLDVLGGIASLTIGPTAPVSGTAPGPYNESNSVNNISESESIDIIGLGSVDLLELGTGVNSTTATSDVDGGPGVRSVTATATVSSVDLGATSVIDLLNVVPFVQLNATTIASTASVTGDNSLTATGSATISGTSGAGGDQASLSILGVEFALDSNPDPNTVLNLTSDVLPGLIGSIDVFLNEQILSGDGVTTQGILVNAVRVQFNAVGLGALVPGVLNGNIIFAQSSAFAATPEPGSMVLMAVFLLGFVGVRWARHLKGWPL